MDTFNPVKRSWVMAQVKSGGNKSTEVRLAAAFRRSKIRGWRRQYPLFGKPDFTFPKQRVAVFVDGCFWHGHPKKCRMPAMNRIYWVNKIARNMARDKLVTRTLRKKGWKVLRIWESSVAKASTITRIRKALS
jgi:DNA mismatch endonuclease (patch repair protein)